MFVDLHMSSMNHKSQVFRDQAPGFSATVAACLNAWQAGLTFSASCAIRAPYATDMPDGANPLPAGTECHYRTVEMALLAPRTQCLTGTPSSPRL